MVLRTRSSRHFVQIYMQLITIMKCLFMFRIRLFFVRFIYSVHQRPFVQKPVARNKYQTVEFNTAFADILFNILHIIKPISNIGKCHNTAAATNNRTTASIPRFHQQSTDSIRIEIKAHITNTWHTWSAIFMLSCSLCSHDADNNNNETYFKGAEKQRTLFILEFYQ